MQYIVILYLAALNLAALAAMGADKRKAERGGRRTPEATLLSLAVLGGSAGAIAGMLLFRHKTRKPAFSVGLPCILLAHLALALLLSSLPLNS